MVAKRDWAEMHQELLHLIAKKVGNLSNFIRFRSVCKQWRAAADPADSPPQLPWILQPEILGRTNSNSKSVYILHSHFSRSTSRVELPVKHREYRYYNEPSIGFILAHFSDQDSIEDPYLYSPLTETKIHLPLRKSARIPLVRMGRSNKSNSSTVKSGVHLIAYTVDCWNDQTEIGSWRSDTNEFFTLKVPFLTFVVSYYKGKIFAFECKTRKTSAFDMTTRAKINVEIPQPAACPRFCFLVEAMGDLLAVYYPYRSRQRGCSNRQFKVYQLEHTDDFGQCKWIKLNGIGERVLFLG